MGGKFRQNTVLTSKFKAKPLMPAIKFIVAFDKLSNPCLDGFFFFFFNL